MCSVGFAQTQVPTWQQYLDLLQRVETLEAGTNPLPPPPPPDPDPNPDPDPPPEPPTGDVLFADDFDLAQDQGWVTTPSVIADYVNVPSRWKAQGGHSNGTPGVAEFSIVPNAGRNGSSAYQIKYKPGLVDGTACGSTTTYFEESHAVCIEFYLKVSEGWRFFDSDPASPYTSRHYWKLFRLEQTPYKGVAPPSNINPIEDSGYAIASVMGPINVYGIGPHPKEIFEIPCMYRDWKHSQGTYASPTHVFSEFSNFRINWGDMQPNGIYTNTRWVRFDFYFQLSDPGQDNGLLIYWIDGELKSPQWSNGAPTRGDGAAPTGGVPPVNTGYMTTEARKHNGHPTGGYNKFQFVDNFSSLTAEHNGQQYVWADDVKITKTIPSDLPLPVGFVPPTQ